MSSLQLVVEQPFIFNEKQLQLLHYKYDNINDEGKLMLDVYAALGQYGGGKTFIAACKYFHMVSCNPYIEGLHTEDAPPTSGMLAPVISDILNGPYKTLKQIVPPEAILKERLYPPHYYITWFNGHRTILHSTKTEINGPSWVGAWADEIQFKRYADIYYNLQSRIRDARAEKPISSFAQEKFGQERAGRFFLIVSGLATRNHVEDLFRYQEGRNRKSIVVQTEDNKVNLGGSVDELKKALPASYFDVDSDGWQQVSGVLFPRFTNENFAKESEYPLEDLVKYPISMGIDFRRYGANVYGVRLKDNDGDYKVIIIGEWLPEAHSAEMMVKVNKTGRFPWDWRRIGVPGSGLFPDPSAAIDEIRHFEDGFKCKATRFLKGPLSASDTGNRIVDWAICDGEGKRRLLVHESCKTGEPRGVVRMLREWTGERNDYEHIGDATRYLVQGLMHKFMPKLKRQYGSVGMSGVGERTVRRLEEIRNG